MTGIVAEFIGGPRDGQVMALPDLRSRWLFPAPLPPFTFCLAPGESDDPLRVYVYDLALDAAMGRPSLSDEGRYRYRFEGQH